MNLEDKLITIQEYEETNSFVYFEMEGYADIDGFGKVLWSEPILLSLN